MTPMETKIASRGRPTHKPAVLRLRRTSGRLHQEAIFDRGGCSCNSGSTSKGTVMSPIQAHSINHRAIQDTTPRYDGGSHATLGAFRWSATIRTKAACTAGQKPRLPPIETP